MNGADRSASSPTRLNDPPCCRHTSACTATVPAGFTYENAISPSTSTCDTPDAVASAHEYDNRGIDDKTLVEQEAEPEEDQTPEPPPACTSTVYWFPGFNFENTPDTFPLRSAHSG